jgi:hypothetical protein
VVQISTATIPATDGRPNEDFVGTLPDAVVLLDGAGSAGAASGCRHGVAWYSYQLGSAILGALASGQEPSAALRTAIPAVMRLHANTCDLNHPGTPSATAIIARLHREDLEYLVLADSVLLIQTSDHIEVITDDREGTIGKQHRQALDSTSHGTPEHERALTDYITAMRAHRNKPGGFWVASVDPQAADEAVTGSIPVSDVESSALLSDGASRNADLFHLTDWAGLLTTLAKEGPTALLRQTRQAEHTDPTGQRWPRGKHHDDATAAYVALR